MCYNRSIGNRGGTRERDGGSDGFSEDFGQGGRFFDLFGLDIRPVKIFLAESSGLSDFCSAAPYLGAQPERCGEGGG